MHAFLFSGSFTVCLGLIYVQYSYRPVAQTACPVLPRARMRSAGVMQSGLSFLSYICIYSFKMKHSTAVATLMHLFCTEASC